MTLEEDCGAKLENPKKLGDHSSFTIPISIGNLSVGRAFLDLGSSINLSDIIFAKQNWKGSNETNTHDDTTSGPFH